MVGTIPPPPFEETGKSPNRKPSLWIPNRASCPSPYILHSTPLSPYMLILDPDGGSPFGIYSPPAPTSLKTPSPQASTTWYVHRIFALTLSLMALVDPRLWTRWPDRERPPCQRFFYPTRFPAAPPTHERHRNWGNPPCPTRYPTAIGSTARRSTNLSARRSPTPPQYTSTTWLHPHRRPTSPRNAQWHRSSHAAWCGTKTSPRSRKIRF